MIFSNKRGIDHRDQDLHIIFNGASIKRVDSERFLGVILDSNLSWQPHISALSGKVSRNSGILFKLKGIVPENILKLVYNSLIQSHLNYCSNVWGLGSKASLATIFRSQKKAIRAIENKYNNAFYNKETGELPCHTKEIFARNKLLTIYNLVAKNCLVAMHKIYHGSGPENIDKLFVAVTNPNYNARRDPNFFEIERSRLVALDKTLPLKGPKMYNHCTNIINKENTLINLRLEGKLLDPFKNIVSHYLLNLQKAGEEEWEPQNFAIHQHSVC